jgi:hypothetical protein
MNGSKPQFRNPSFNTEYPSCVIIQNIQSASPSEGHNTSEEIRVLDASSTQEFWMCKVSFVYIYSIFLSKRQIF